MIFSMHNTFDGCSMEKHISTPDHILLSHADDNICANIAKFKFSRGTFSNRMSYFT